jgi:hypothetical protein
MPANAEAVTSSHMGAHPAISIAASPPQAAAAARSAAIITRNRGSRSAITPPSSMNTTIANASAAVTTDSVVAVAPGNARTPNASATGPNALPSTEAVRAANSSPKRRSRRIFRSLRTSRRYPSDMTDRP